VLLQDEGYAVYYAPTGRDARAVLEAGKLKIGGLITDIRCGTGPNGWEIAHQARSLMPNLPVVYVSGNCAADHASLGVTHSVMVPKPFHNERLLEAVRTLLRE